jgi:hypothetical protein
MERVFIGATRAEATRMADEWWGRQKGLRQTLRTEVAVGGKEPDAQLDQWAITIRYEDEDSRSGAGQACYVNRADDPVRTLSELVGERIAAAMAGRPVAEIVPLKTART